MGISTDVKPDNTFPFDVMNRGALNPAWGSNIETYMDTDSTELDFFYVTIYGEHEQLTINSFKITSNSTLFSNTTLFLERVVKEKASTEAKTTYSLRINYRCNEDAAKAI